MPEKKAIFLGTGVVAEKIHQIVRMNANSVQ